MNKKLLLDLFRIPARSGKEGAIQIFIEKELQNMGISYDVDIVGNVFNLDNKDAPLLCAHMDTVQDEIDAKLSHFTSIKGNYITGYGVIGGDDKCGIYIILEILKSRKDLNFVFTVEEEAGGAGMRMFIQEQDFSDILYGIVLDRRGNSDILCAENDYGTKKFEIILKEIGKIFGYKPERGLWSDTDILSECISCTNLSVGYYNPHQKSEFVILKDLENAKNFTWAIVKNVNEKFQVPRKICSTYGSYRGNSYNMSYNDEYNDYEQSYNEWCCEICGEMDYLCEPLETIDKIVCKQCFKRLFEEMVDIDKEKSILSNMGYDILEEVE